MSSHYKFLFDFIATRLMTLSSVGLAFCLKEIVRKERMPLERDAGRKVNNSGVKCCSSHAEEFFFSCSCLHQGGTLNFLINIEPKEVGIEKHKISD